jgi:hypothetical protein
MKIEIEVAQKLCHYRRGTTNIHPTNDVNDSHPEEQITPAMPLPGPT